MAADTQGTLRALKVQVPSDPSKLAAIAARYARLQPLTSHPGLVALLSHGVTDQGQVWEAMPLADNLPGLPPVTEEAGRQQYTPLTMRSWIVEKIPAGAEQVARWGLSLAKALGVLHAEGLVHRDVKPANVMFLGGAPHLGDYGLVGEPGAEPDFSGTEGFKPLEGTNDSAADLFALGKTLYEVWTGRSRLEYPSLPRAVLDSADWHGCGSRLNQVLLRACHSQPSRRFRSAAEFGEALEAALEKRCGVNRRLWLVGAAAAIGLTAAAFVGSRWLRAPARAVWRRVRAEGFNVELWEGNAQTVDWDRRRIYSLAEAKKGCVFFSLNLDDFSMDGKAMPDLPLTSPCTILHPGTRQLWAIEGGYGEVFSMNPQTLALARLGGGPTDKMHFGARAYWNPVTRRIGVFGGYGYLAVRNDRHEFDEAKRRWIEIEPNRPQATPWPRSLGLPLVQDPSGEHVYLVGGLGSPSGKQAERFPDLPGFDGRFHNLDDVWELDLKTNRWRQLLPLGHLNLARVRLAVHHPELQGLVVMLSPTYGPDLDPDPASMCLLRPGIDDRPRRLPATGDISALGQVWAWTVDPSNGETLLFASDGIFRIRIEV
ncbi:MAG TPA: kelch repeat-containing protein [Verrucomicrobiota bacterium]|nr:kelch repeat-containing protein [Verrucomicrobiota bacterium]HNU52592.1 kelch repeat-containing protein [Verrucomicrobiota bacterium]